MINQGQFLGPSFSPVPYTNPVDNTDGFFHGVPQGTLSNISPPRHPPGHHHRHPHTRSTPMVSGHHAFNLGGSYNTEASRTFPLDVTYSTQEGRIGGSMAAVGSIRPPALPPQAGSIDFFPIRRRRVHSFPCPVSGCLSSPLRIQDQRRHLLTHFPHRFHCPAPDSDCPWRGDRFDTFVRHWSNDHPSRIQVPNEGQCRIYDPRPLMKAVSEHTLCIRAAQNQAISMVKRRASELRKPELFENPWGSKWKRSRNSDPRRLVPTN